MKNDRLSNARIPTGHSLALTATAFAALLLLGLGALAQSPPVTASSSSAPVHAAPAQGQSAEGYSYKPEGRRDPFVSLVRRGSEARPSGKRVEGLQGLTFDEIAVRGIVQSQGGFVAMVQGPDLKSYIVHVGDRLLDGTVKAITADSLVVLQEVNDPLSLVKQRELRKRLRVAEDVK
jgi:Tfp pilus assembly protein PilP